MINPDKLKQFYMSQTQVMPNIKELKGCTVTPVSCLESQYTDADGKIHNVLAIEFAGKGFYRTEVAAFVDKFRSYWMAFGEIEDGETRPDITITGNQSKRGNPFISFDIVNA